MIWNQQKLGIITIPSQLMGFFVLKDAITCEKTQEYLAITEGPKTAPVTVEYPLATLMVSLTRGEAGSPDNSFFTPKLAGSEGTCKDHHRYTILGELSSLIC